MIIFLNGSINAGKSTVAQIMVKVLPNSALLEVDALREMIDWMPLADSIPINLENAVLLIRNFAHRNLNVIVPYPLSQKNYEYLTKELRDMHVPIYFFTLAPILEKALVNRGTRELTKEEKARVREHYEKMIPQASFGEIIDNSNITPEETVAYILKKINYTK